MSPLHVLTIAAPTFKMSLGVLLQIAQTNDLELQYKDTQSHQLIPQYLLFVSCEMKVLATLLFVVLAIALLPEQAEAVDIGPCFHSCRAMETTPKIINKCIARCKKIGRRKLRREKNCLSELLAIYIINCTNFNIFKNPL